MCVFLLPCIVAKVIQCTAWNAQAKISNTLHPFHVSAVHAYNKEYTGLHPSQSISRSPRPILLTNKHLIGGFEATFRLIFLRSLIYI